MDTKSLVNEQIDDGYTLISNLTEDGVDVAVASWVKTSEEGEYFLYIGSKLVDEKGLADAYRIAYGELERMPQSQIVRSQLKLVGLNNPISQDMARR